METDLVKWVNKELERRGWTIRELSRRAGLSHTAINVVLSGQRQPTWDLCFKIAGAMGKPPVDVFKMAGLLPPRTASDELIEQIIYHFDQLTPADQQRLIAIARTLGQSDENRQE